MHRKLNEELEKEQNNNTKQILGKINQGTPSSEQKALDTETHTRRKRGYDPRAVIREEEEKLGPLKYDEERGELYYGTSLRELALQNDNMNRMSSDVETHAVGMTK